jgi:hypothetical protein
MPWADGEVTRRTERSLPLARRYELTWLNADGTVADRIEIAPALPLFEDAFSAFTHGTLIHTSDGEIPVEDLTPGATLLSPNGSTVTLLWKGAITLVPGAPTHGEGPASLYRVTADAFGPGRPGRDLLLGPAARRLVRSAEVRERTGSEAALVPFAHAADGCTVIEMQMLRPTRVYHLLADDHATIQANGLEVETFHPADTITLSLSSEMRQMYLSLFPHLLDGRDFGRRLWPQLLADDL